MAIEAAKASELGLQSRKDEAYEAIRSRILSGEFAPATPLSEHQLAANFSLSRTPVREAIKRLEREGLVRSIPSRGTFVTEITPQDILEIYQVRERLEGLAARIAAEHMSEAEISSLEAEIALMHPQATDGNVGEVFESDVRLHKRILAATKNSRLIGILAMLDDQMYRVRALLPGSAAWLEETLRDHSEIVAHIRARNADAAESAMIGHLRRACEHAMRLAMPLRI